MKKLIDKLETLLADSFSMYLLAHNAHWNVVGPEFLQAHGFYGDIYTNVWGTLDDIAENIRRLGEAVDGFQGLEENRSRHLPNKMPVREYTFKECNEFLQTANDHVLDTIKDCIEEADTPDTQGILNYLADRQDWHQKMKWQLKALLSDRQQSDNN